MNLDREDEKLEGYLRQFQARAPRPLPRQEKPILFRRPAMAMAAAAAAVVVVAVALLALRGREAPPQQPPARVAAQAEPVPQQISMIRLSRIAREDPEKLGRHLDELSTRLLPDVRGSHGVLKHLARE